MSKINLNSILSEPKNAVERIVETVKVAQQPLPDFDAILMEWSWRCEKGYPDFNNKQDMAALKEVLKEMDLPEIDIQGSGLTQLQEALSQEQQDAVKASTSLFTVENINKLGYGNYVNKIVNAFAEYTTKDPDPAVLAYFIQDKIMINTPAELQTFIKAYQTDKLVIRLYTIAAKDAQDDKPESGRGAMGRGEVLIGMLTQKESGGTVGADNAIGSTPYEVKASKETVIKIPLAAKRINRLTSLNRLDDVYAACKSFMDDKVAWEDYVKGCFPKGSKLASKAVEGMAGGKYIFDAGIAPSSGNINGQEIENFKIFFNALKEKLSSKDTTDDEYYVDLDSITQKSDKYFKGIVKNPAIFNDLQKGNIINIEVVEGDATTAVELQRMETRLKQCKYIQDPAEFGRDLISDCKKLLENRFIVFHEEKGAINKVPVPVLLTPDEAENGDKILIVNFSLNAAAISFKGSLSTAEAKELEASM